MRTQILRARFVVRKASPGTGHGLFAASAISASDFVLEYKGRHVPTATADSLKTRYLFEIDNTWTIDGSSRANRARYINHSCEPNCEASIRDGRVLIHALRDIKKGEELTIDYGEEYFKEFIEPHGCKCVRCTRPVLKKSVVGQVLSGKPRMSALAFWRR